LFVSWLTKEKKSACKKANGLILWQLKCCLNS
jgi:hypothetical protein